MNPEASPASMPVSDGHESARNAGLERAYAVAERAKRMISDLLARNAALSDEVRAIKVRPLPPSDDPGYEVWRALMEDLREDGLARLSVRTQTVMEVTYEAV